jgi:diguanylate cyclase (GGDEF)-like protein
VRGGAVRLAVVFAFGALALTVGVTALHVAGLGGRSWNAPVRDWGSSLAYVLVGAIVALRAFSVSRDRGPWALIAIGVALYGAGNVLWSLWIEHIPNPPIPSLSDGFWLALYPASYVGLLWLARRSVRAASRTVLLDGLVAGLGLAAIGAALVSGRVLHPHAPDLGSLVTELAYPVCDLLLAALVIGLLVVRGGRSDRMWVFLGLGFFTLAVADCMYLVGVANGAVTPTGATNLTYLIGSSMLAIAAWQRPGPETAPSGHGQAAAVLSCGFVVAAVVILALERVMTIDVVAIVLALLTIVAGMVRSSLAFRDVGRLATARHEAQTDDLTGLANRRQLRVSLEEAVTAADAGDHTAALLMLDIDHFKELNDTLGRQAGDEVLRQLGPRLARAVRPQDTVARIGGDVFAVLLSGPVDPALTRSIATRLHRVIDEAFPILGLNLAVHSSIGLALYPDHAKNSSELMRRADVALYEAKASGSATVVYAVGQDPHSRARRALAIEIEHGLHNGELELLYQPVADGHDRHIVEVEALARWRHPTRGLLTPDQFIGAALESGLGRALTREVLRIALIQVSTWRDAGLDIHVAINVTAADLADVNLPDEVETALSIHDLPATCLTIEVTESSVLSDPARAREVMGRLRALGVVLSLDDFGTGYSSLTHLRELPVDQVKIDRSFVAHMCEHGTDAAIIASTLHLTQALGLEAVAEGVEDEQTWTELTDAGCQLMQGYVLSRPVPADEIPALVDAAAVAPAR